MPQVCVKLRPRTCISIYISPLMEGINCYCSSFSIIPSFWAYGKIKLSLGLILNQCHMTRSGHCISGKKDRFHFSSVAQWCRTLCNPMDCSMPGFPVHHRLPELAQTHVHQVGDAIQPSQPLSSPSPPAFNLFLASGSFPTKEQRIIYLIY